MVYVCRSISSFHGYIYCFYLSFCCPVTVTLKTFTMNISPLKETSDNISQYINVYFLSNSFSNVRDELNPHFDKW